MLPRGRGEPFLFPVPLGVRENYSLLQTEPIPLAVSDSIDTQHRVSCQFFNVELQMESHLSSLFNHISQELLL